MERRKRRRGRAEAPARLSLSRTMQNLGWTTAGGLSLPIGHRQHFAPLAVGPTCPWFGSDFQEQHHHRSTGCESSLINELFREAPRVNVSP